MRTLGDSSGRGLVRATTIVHRNSGLVRATTLVHRPSCWPPLLQWVRARSCSIRPASYTRTLFFYLLKQALKNWALVTRLKDGIYRWLSWTITLTKLNFTATPTFLLRLVSTLFPSCLWQARVHHFKTTIITQCLSSFLPLCPSVSPKHWCTNSHRCTTHKHTPQPTQIHSTNTKHTHHYKDNVSL